MKRLLIVMLMFVCLSGYSQDIQFTLREIESSEIEKLKVNTALLVVELYKDYYNQLDSIEVPTVIKDTIVFHNNRLINYKDYPELLRLDKKEPTFDDFIEWLRKEYLPNKVKNYKR